MKKNPPVNETEQRTDERGQALFLVIFVMVLVLAVGAAMIQVAGLNTTRVVENKVDTALLNGARVGLAQGKFLFWDSYQESLAPADRPGPIEFARTYYTSGAAPFGALTPNVPTLIASMRMSGGDIGTVSAVTTEPVFVRVWVTLFDDGGLDVYMLVRSVATGWDTSVDSNGLNPLADRAAQIARNLPADQRIAERVWKLGGEPFSGFEYALLANAINCTFCHADFDDAKRYWDPNTDPDPINDPDGSGGVIPDVDHSDDRGQYQRIKVASLQELKVGGTNTDPTSGGWGGGGNADTRIAGTLFVQGNSQDIDGDDLSPATSGSDVTSRDFAADTFILQETDGTAGDPDSFWPGETSFADGGRDAGTGEYDDPNANLYLNYPTDPAIQKALAGRLPAEFPPVIPDDGSDGAGGTNPAELGNRLVDDGEWAAHLAANDFTGTISAGANASGPGAIQVVKNFSGSSLPSSNSGNVVGGTITGGTTGGLGGASKKNLIIIGTWDDPIVINGDVAIDGDVVIGGVIQGTGQLLARGNMYLLGDLRYKDGADGAGLRTFGVQADGSSENAVAFAAGGMVVHGNFLTSADSSFGWGGGGADLPLTGENPNEAGGTFDFTGTAAYPGEGSGGGQRTFTINEIAIWNRGEFIKTMPYIDADTGFPTSDATSKYTGADNTVDAQKNPLYLGATYKPRFYTVEEHTGLAPSKKGKIWIYGAGVEENGRDTNPNPKEQDAAVIAAASAAGIPTEGTGSSTRTKLPYSWVRLVDEDSDGVPDKALWMNHDIQDSGYEQGTIPLGDVLNGMDTGSGRAADLAGGGYSTRAFASSFMDLNSLRDLTLDYEAKRAAAAENLTTNPDSLAADGQPFRLDGLYYTNNGMLFMARKSSSSGGNIEFNGSVVAADTGILAGSHLQLNYDVRTSAYLRIQDKRNIQLYVLASRER